VWGTPTTPLRSGAVSRWEAKAVPHVSLFLNETNIINLAKRCLYKIEQSGWSLGNAMKGIDDVTPREQNWL
jgi:hypothetical protein